MNFEIENFFGNAQAVIDLSKNLKFYTFDEHPEPESVGRYRGKRTVQLHNINKELFDSFQYGVISHLVDLSRVKQCYSRVSAYFSLLSSDDKTSEIPIIHQDNDVLYAGVVYLSENPDKHSGTSLYKKESNKYELIHEFENKFNKMVMYDGSTFHGTTKFVDGRMSIVFFVKDLDFTYLTS
jgi:hypothetical protein